VVPVRLGICSLFNLNSELLPSLSATAIFPLGRAVMEDWAYHSTSELSTQLNLSSGSWLTDYLVQFPTLGSEDLVRLGEDLLHVYPISYKDWSDHLQNETYVSLISNVISRAKTSPTGLSSEEATALTEIFRKVPLHRQIPSRCLTSLVVRLYLDFRRITFRTRG